MRYFRAYMTPGAAIITPVEVAEVDHERAYFDDGTRLALRCAKGGVFETATAAADYLLELLDNREKAARQGLADDLENIAALRVIVEGARHE